MTIKSTDSCALYEIQSLSNHKSAQDAMEAFCRQSLGVVLTFRGEEDKAPNKVLASCYLFSGLDTKGSYAPAFASLIERESLGELITTPPLVNKAWHPERKNQLWFWMPRQDNLQDWWAAVQVAKAALERKSVKGEKVKQ